MVGFPPKSSISMDLIGFSMINHPFWGTTILGNPHMFWFIFRLGHFQKESSPSWGPLRIQHLVVNKHQHRITRQWFQTFFIFNLTWGDDPIWRASFSNGLKPPTRSPFSTNILFVGIILLGVIIPVCTLIYKLKKRPFGRESTLLRGLTTVMKTIF